MRLINAPGPIWTGWPSLGMGNGSSPSTPTLTVTNGTITPFSRSGVDYVEVLFSASGSFTLSADIDWHNRALGAGGGTGGRATSVTYPPGGGGAGGLLRTLATALPAGAYTVTIGAGGARIAAGSLGNQGSDSVLARPDGTETAIGGGYGGAAGSWTSPGNGGSGGGSRASATATGVGGFGIGTPGQGYNGSRAINSTVAGEAASGGGGGAGGTGADASAGVPATAGPGVLLDWIASPATVCIGGAGMLAAATDASPDAVLGSGTRGAINADVGKGGDGFLFLVVRADQVSVVAA